MEASRERIERIVSDSLQEMTYIVYLSIKALWEDCPEYRRPVSKV